MSSNRRRRAGAWLSVLVCCLAASPAQAEPRAVLAGPAASGWVLAWSKKPRVTTVSTFAVQPIGPTMLRFMRETCDKTCVLDDLIVPGTMETDGMTKVVIKTTHPKLGAVTLTGKLEGLNPGATAQCRLSWPGSIRGFDAGAADYHRVTWSGRIGNLTVTPFKGNPCSYHHLAGVLVVS